MLYSNASSHDNAVNGLKHYHDFMGLPRPKFKYLKTSPERLITAPKKEEVLRVLKEVQPLDVKAYMALCSTVGLRPQRLLKACWHEIDFENGIVNISENVRSKRYRPNPLHEDVSKLLRQLQTTTRPNGRVFNFDAHKIRNSLKAIRTSLRPHDMRDFFYNHASRSGVDKDLVEWCMGR
jgi:integrase